MPALFPSIPEAEADQRRSTRPYGAYETAVYAVAQRIGPGRLHPGGERRPAVLASAAAGQGAGLRPAPGGDGGVRRRLLSGGKSNPADGRYLPSAGVLSLYGRGLDYRLYNLL